MYWPVAVFEIACWTVFSALFLYFLVTSIRQRSMNVGMWMVIGVFGMSWMEAPFDNAMYAVFHPDFHRLPDWGPIGATQGQLPVIAPPGYILYFMVPALLAVYLARKAMVRYGWNQGVALLGIGLAVGIAWDALFEVGEAHTAHLWAYGRVAPGLTISAGSLGMVPVYVFLAMAAFIAPLTYVLGARDRAGEPLFLSAIARKVKPGGARTVATLVAALVFTNVVYALTYLPHLIVNEANLMTTAGVLTPFPGQIARQPGIAHVQNHGALGALIVWGGLIAMMAAAFWIVRRIDASLAPRTQSSTSETDMGALV